MVFGGLTFKVVAFSFAAHRVIASGRPLFRTVRSMSTFSATTTGANLAQQQGACANVHLVPMFTDNYGFILVPLGSSEGVLVDPGDPEPLLNAATELGLRISTILCTHKHADHVGGVTEIKNKVPEVIVFGTKYENIPGLMHGVGDGDKFQLGSLDIEVIHAPCHTKGHVLYYITDRYNMDASPILFSGDTLFVGGCGRFFEGTASEMQRNMERISSLPPQTVVYCAHEYTESNLKFLASVDPDTCSEEYERVVALRTNGIPTVPTTIGKELEYNLFIKCGEKRLQELLGTATADDTMGKLRIMKNSF